MRKLISMKVLFFFVFSLLLTIGIKETVAVENTIPASSMPVVKTIKSALDVKAAGNYVYVADYAGFAIVDMSTPKYPFLLSKLITPDISQDVFVSGTKAYVATSNIGLSVIDISNPAKPLLTRTMNTPGKAYGVFVQGNTAYVADYTSGLAVIDLTTNKITAQIDTSSFVEDVVVSGNYAYLSDYANGVTVVDLTTKKIVMSVKGKGAVRSIALSGKTLYTADSNNGLGIYDITVPTLPVYKGGYLTGPATDVSVITDSSSPEPQVLVAHGSSGVSRIDVSNPTAPSLLEKINTTGYGFGVTAANGEVIVADGSVGVTIITNRYQ